MPRSASSANRSGMIALITMTALLLAAAVSAILVQSVLQQYHYMEQRQMSAQADLLAQSAFDRAAALLRSGAGEKLKTSWQPDLENEKLSAQVDYEVSPGAMPDRKLVKIVAKIANGGPAFVRSTLAGEVQILPE